MKQPECRNGMRLRIWIEGGSTPCSLKELSEVTKAPIAVYQTSRDRSLRQLLRKCISDRSNRGAVLNQPFAAIAVTSTRMPSTANAATPTAARTGQGLAKKRL